MSVCKGGLEVWTGFSKETNPLTCTLFVYAYYEGHVLYTLPAPFSRASLPFVAQHEYVLARRGGVVEEVVGRGLRDSCTNNMRCVASRRR